MLSALLLCDVKSTCVSTSSRTMLALKRNVSCSSSACLLLRSVSRYRRREYACVQALRVHRKRSDCSKAQRNPQQVDLCVLASSRCRELLGNAGTQGRPVAGFSVSVDQRRNTVCLQVQLTVETLQRCQHGPCEAACVLLTRKVESIHLSVVSPLVEGRGGLVVLEPLQDGAVDDHLKEIRHIHMRWIYTQACQSTRVVYSFSIPSSCL